MKARAGFYILLALIASSATGCDRGAFLVVEVDSVTQLDVARLHVTSSAKGREVAFDVRPQDAGPTFAIPPSQTFGIEIPPSFIGDVFVRVTAFDEQDRPLGEAEGTRNVTAGGTTTLRLTIGADGGDGGAGDGGGVVITPDSVALAAGASQQFMANVPVDWTVQEGAAGGTIDASGLYTAPTAKGVYHVVATSQANPMLSATATVSVVSGALELLAGQPGGPGNLDGVGKAARFNAPRGIASDSSGNVYVADALNHCIRRIDASTQAVTTFAGLAGTTGSADGVGTTARFSGPSGLASDGTYLYVADFGNHTIRQITIATATVVTLAGRAGQPGTADGAASTAQFNGPWGVTLEGGAIYVTNANGHSIKKIAGGVVTTIAGSQTGTSGAMDGTGTASRFNIPYDLIGDGAGTLYISDLANCVIRKLVLSSGVVSTFAGTFAMAGSTDGTGAAARFNGPRGLAIDSGSLYVADSDSRTIRKIVLSTAVVSTVAGTADTPGDTDGTGMAALLRQPSALTRAPSGALYITDTTSHVIRRLEPATGAVATVAGAAPSPGSIDGTETGARFDRPTSVTADGQIVYVADSGNRKVRRINVGTKAVTTLNVDAVAVLADGAGHLYYVHGLNQTIDRYDIGTQMSAVVAGTVGGGNSDGVGGAAAFRFPFALALDGAGNLYVADSGNHCIKRVELASSTVTTIAGSTMGMSGSSDGAGTAARFNDPRGVAVGSGVLYVADTGNSTIRRVNLGTGMVDTLAGSPGMFGSSDGTGPVARFRGPRALVLESSGTLLVADADNAAVRRVDPSSGTVSTVVGGAGRIGAQPGPLPASLSMPLGLTLLSGGDAVVADFNENAVFRVRAP
jgi:streptogramin lyase